MKNCVKAATVSAQVRQQMFTKARKRGQRKVPTTTAKVPSWFIRADGRKP